LLMFFATEERLNGPGIGLYLFALTVPVFRLGHATQLTRTR
jgi:hypothetical protein